MRLPRKRIAVTVLALAVFAVAGLVAHHALAQQQGQARQTQVIPEVPIYQEVIIPGESTEQAASGFLRGRVRDLADYLGVIYNFLISIVGALAATMMMVGGFQYLTAGGDKNKVDAGKARIVNALMGMILALGSYVLLNTINPNLVNLKVPTVPKVTTEYAFLPFCDTLATRLNVDIKDIKFASPSWGNDCGAAGFYSTQAQTATSTVESRVWCVFRGQHKTDNRIDQDFADYGCADELTSDSFKTLQICLPNNGVNGKQLDAEYAANKVINERLGKCSSCIGLGDGRMKAMNYPVGDDACKAWQDVANNGDPTDDTFDVTKKKIIQDSRVVGNDTRADRIYYCGYTPDNHACTYVPILCHNVSDCGGYEKMAPHYCEACNSASCDCHSYNTLGSKDVRKSGDVYHLYPICNANPCHVAGACEVPGLAGVQGALGGGQAIRVGVRIFTAGLAGTVDCSSKSK